MSTLALAMALRETLNKSSPRRRQEGRWVRKRKLSRRSGTYVPQGRYPAGLSQRIGRWFTWMSGNFLARHPAGGEELIQVCASLDDPAARERETRALIEAAPHHPAATLHLIALDIPAAIDIPPGIALHRAADWMLAEGE